MSVYEQAAAPAPRPTPHARQKYTYIDSKTNWSSPCYFKANLSI